jgi:small subunit ribosomal protein S26e
MPVKRRNHGRQRKNRGSTNRIQCNYCGASVGKDKAVSRTANLPVIENALTDDMNQATIHKTPEIPTFMNMENYCISCACTMKVVRTRNANARKIRRVKQASTAESS